MNISKNKASKLLKRTALAASLLLSATVFSKPLDVLWFSDNNEGKVLVELAEQYAKTHPDFKINLIEVAYSDIDTRLRTMISGKTPPAFARVGLPTTYADYAVDLTSYINKDEFLKTFEPYYVKNGKVVGVPMDVTANGMIYNKTLFDQAGVKAPLTEDEIWTWDQFETNIKKVMDNSDARFGLVWDYTPHRFSTLMYQYNAHFINEKDNTLAFNSPELVKALNQFKKLHDNGVMPKSVWVGSDNPNSLFRSGKVAVHLAGSWMLSNYDQIKSFEWGVMYMPKGDRRASVPGGKFIQAFKGSGQEKEAAEFIKWLSEQKQNAYYDIHTQNISPRIDNANLVRERHQEDFQIFAKELNASPNYGAVDWGSTEVTMFQNEFKDLVSKVVAGKTMPEKGLESLEKKVTRLIKRNKK